MRCPRDIPLERRHPSRIFLPCKYPPCSTPPATYSPTPVVNTINKSSIAYLLSPNFPITNTAIHNFSDKVLTPDETFVLGLGLKFCITSPPLPDTSLQESYDVFARNIRLRWQFRNDHSSADPLRLPATNFQPRRASAPIESYLTTVKQRLDAELERHPTASFKQPLVSRRINNVIRALQKDTSIVIKPADKNLGTTVVSRTWYEAEALRQLEDASTYKRLEALPTLDQVFEPALAALRKYDQLISKEHTAFILERYHKKSATPAKFYMTIKVHKKPLTGRPICSSIGTATANASRWVDSILQPYLQRIPAHLKDSRSLIKTLEETRFPDDIDLCTADVTSLYPSIPTDAGLAALREFLNYHHRDKEQIPLILILAEWVLKFNILQFGNTSWLQINGTAMGTPFAVSYATIFLDQLERKVLQQITAPERPLLYKRYIDDLLLVCLREQHRRTFIALFNNQHATIKITDVPGNEVPFLDLSLSKGTRFQLTGSLDISLFQKEQNKYLYIPPVSYHPPRICRAFVKAELQRFRTICSNDEDFNAAANRFLVRLRARGHDTENYRDLLEEVPTRDEILAKINSKQSKTTAAPLLFKTTWNPRTARINMKHILSIPDDIAETAEVKQIFKARRPITCFKKARSLGSFLANAKHDFEDRPKEISPPNT